MKKSYNFPLCLHKYHCNNNNNNNNNNILVTAFIQGIYNYTPETNHVSRVYSVAADLYLHFVLHVTLFRP